MKINWFPGHMTKALRMMNEQSKLVDCFLYVLDARAYKACINPSFNEIIKDKPVLYILNKADMIEKNLVNIIINNFTNQGKTIIATNSRQSGSNSPIINAIKKINSEKLERYTAKKVNKAIRAMVIGVPNTGKSTLINKLCGNKKTITGNRPGVTKGKQWIVIDNSLELLDTPGTLCPAFNEEWVGTHMAFVGSIRDAVVDMEMLSYELILYLITNHKASFEERYNIKVLENELTLNDEINSSIVNKIPNNHKPICNTSIIIEKIAKSRGFYLKGGEIDIERVYNTVIDDFRKCKFGKIALELP